MHANLHLIIPPTLLCAVEARGLVQGTDKGVHYDQIVNASSTWGIPHNGETKLSTQGV
jgi:hypothetical protein